MTRSSAALVTGCSSGIGRATALALVGAGFPTYATTDVFGLVRMTQLALPGMRRQGWGRVVNIKTRFGDTALGSEPPVAPTGPYAGLVRMLDQRGRVAYALTARGASAQDVARVIVKAVTAAHPATRCQVTAEAPVLPAIRALLPDRAWDRLLRWQFPAHD